MAKYKNIKDLKVSEAYKGEGGVWRCEVSVKRFDSILAKLYGRNKIETRNMAKATAKFMDEHYEAFDLAHLV